MRSVPTTSTVAIRTHPPPPGGAPEASQHRVDALHQMGLVLAAADPRSEPPRMGQDTHQHERCRPPRCVPHLDPVPLAFLTRRMINHHRRSASGSRTCPTRRPQLTVADLADERWIALPITQSGHFVEQSRRPKVGVVGQPLPNISPEGIERIRLRRPGTRSPHR